LNKKKESKLEDEKIKPCPCGKTPIELYVVDSGQDVRWAQAYANCCGEWIIDFGTKSSPLDSEECMEYALKAWNDAPRGLVQD